MTFHREKSLIILSGKEKQKIIDLLKKQYGIHKLKGVLLRRGTERIFLFQGSFSANKIQDLEKVVPIERAGIYFGKIQEDKKGYEFFRLSIDGIHLLQNQISKGIFELNKRQALEFLHGNELNINSKEKGFLIMKYKDDFIGTGKASAEKISNFLPKNRRLREKS
ncbi:MAG: hypothetical protein ACE5ES_00460 [Candidatus Nanoarchaeia archaeon]